MKRLTLIRHAKSHWDQPELSDFDRPLNKRGEQDAPLIGDRLAVRGLSPQLILSSPAKRAIDTARLIAQALTYPKKKILEEPGIYEANVDELVALLWQVAPKINDLMMVGHNPGLHQLTHYLTGQRLEKFPTCGVFSVEFDLEQWADIRPGSAQLDFFDYPKNTATAEPIEI